MSGIERPKSIALPRDREKTIREHHSFQIKDDKGRLIGAAVYKWEETFVPYTGDCRYGYSHREAGHYFVVRTSSTRNEMDYGALQYASYFKTEAERDRHIAKYLRDAQKRRQHKPSGGMKL